MDENEIRTDDPLVFYGGEVKALGDGRVGGYLVRFGNEQQTDLEDEYFDAQTDFGKARQSTAYYAHGYDERLGKKSLANDADIGLDAVGVWIAHQLDLRDDYERAIYGMAEKHKLGWSSGTAPHLVEREQKGRAVRIARWPLGLDASYTPTPAEPRNTALPLKAWLQGANLEALVEAGGESAPNAGEAPETVTDIKSTAMEKPTTEVEVHQMDENEVKAVAEATVKAFWESHQAETIITKPAGYVTPGGDSADRALKGNPFKSFGEMAMAAVHDKKNKDERLFPLQSLDGYQIPAKLLAVKAPTGLGETVGASGGFLVGTDRSAANLEPRNWGTGSVVSRISLDTISANSNGMTYPAENETSRVAGARHGGVRGYWVSEGTAKTPSQPAFRAMELRLHKACALVYATDELLGDASALQSYLMRVYPDELTFLVENAIVAGTGAGQPQGVLLSPALVTQAIVAGQANTTVVAQNLISMWSRRYIGAGDYVWFINQDVTPQLMQLSLPVGAAGGQLIYMPPGGISGAPYGSIFGRPVIEIEYCSTLGTVGDIILCAMSQYQGIQKGGVEAASSIHFLFDHDETAFRFVYRFDGQSLWNSAVTPHSGSTNTVSPFVTLAGRP